MAGRRRPSLTARTALAAGVAVAVLGGASCTVAGDDGAGGDRATTGHAPSSTVPATAGTERTAPAVTGTRPPTTDPGPRPTTAPPATSTTAPPTTSPPTSAAAPAVDLAALVIDDRPNPPVSYRREDWPHWDDVDGDGCDARQQALRDASTTPPQVDPYGCQVLAGDWVSIYDGLRTESPSDLDVDHVVSLANAHQSGGWAWTAPQRRAFANDQANLLPVSAESNRAKGAKSPDEWRPPQPAAWCTFATRWVQVKVRYGLTATTPERDALGALLATCPDGGAQAVPPLAASPSTEAPPSSTTVAPPPPPPPPAAGGGGVSYRNCDAARAAGAAPIRAGEPGYRPALDRDGDGIACE